MSVVNLDRVLRLAAELEDDELVCKTLVGKVKAVDATSPDPAGT